MDERTVQAGAQSPASPGSAKPEPDHVFGPRPRLRLAGGLAGEVGVGDPTDSVEAEDPCDPAGWPPQYVTEAELRELAKMPATEPGDEGSGCPAHTDPADPADSEDLEDQALRGQPFAVTVTASGLYAWRCARSGCLAGGEDGIALATRSAWAHAETAHGLSEPTSINTGTPSLDALLAEHGPDGAGACRGCGYVFDPDDVSAWCPTVLAKMLEPRDWVAELLAGAGDYSSVTVTDGPLVNALDRVEVAVEVLAAREMAQRAVLRRIEVAIAERQERVQRPSWAQLGGQVFTSVGAAAALIWAWLVLVPVVDAAAAGLGPVEVVIVALTLGALWTVESTHSAVAAATALWRQWRVRRREMARVRAGELPSSWLSEMARPPGRGDRMPGADEDSAGPRLVSL